MKKFLTGISLPCCSISSLMLNKKNPNCNLRTLFAEILNPYGYDNANYAVLIAALDDHSNCQAVWVSWFLFSRSLPV